MSVLIGQHLLIGLQSILSSLLYSAWGTVQHPSFARGSAVVTVPSVREAVLPSAGLGALADYQMALSIGARV